MTRIPMLDLKREYEYMKADIDAAIIRCLEHQQWIFGPEVKRFEDAVANYLGVKHCVGTSSGTDALVLALRALAIKTKGQEYFDRSDLIITTPFTFTATGDAILRAGATPLFIDIDPTTYNIDQVFVRSCVESFPSGLSPLADSRSRVVGILPVHLYGQSCQMDEIMTIAYEHNLFVVEDCAQAFGAEWLTEDDKKRKAGSIGTAGCFSFFPSKNLGAFGDAGAVSTNDDEISELIRMLLKHGGENKYNIKHVGYNARLDTLQAAILLAKLKYIDEFNACRYNVAMRYNEYLKNIEGLILPCKDGTVFANLKHVYHQYTIRVINGQRDKLQNKLRCSEIASEVYYPIPLHKMKAFNKKSVIYGILKEAELATSEVLSLPIEPLMSDDEVMAIVSCCFLQ